MRTTLLVKMTVSAALSLCALAASAQQDVKEGPCKQISEACTKAGFVKGDAKDGKGLWKDCIDPIMQGTTAKKSTLPLPTVDAATVTQCKQKHPKFGSGKAAN